MFQFFNDIAQYSKLKKQQIEKAEFQSQRLDQSAEDFLEAAFNKLKLGSLGGANSGNRRTEIRTPVKLKPFLEQILSLPPELSAWLVMYKIGQATLIAGLPIELQGDIMMAFEVANYILPEMKDEAARHLACALCIMPSLSRARATLLDLGVPFQEGELSEEDIKVLIKQGYLPGNMAIPRSGFTRLYQNIEMQKAVISELQNIVPNAVQLFKIDRVHGQ